jgi:hypothetical protein
LKQKSFDRAKLKFWVELFEKSSQIPKTASLVALRRVRHPLSSGAFAGEGTELCSVAKGNFAQSFTGKKSKLQIENLFSICFSVREKPP